MSALRILSLARRVVLQLAADRRTIALIVVVPLIAMIVVGVLVRTETNRTRIGIVQQDEGAALPLGLGQVNLGERLAENLGTLNSAIQVEVLDADSAAAKLRAGALGAVMTLPPTFSATAINDKAITLAVTYEGSNPMAARVLEAAVAGAAMRTLAGISPIVQQNMPTIAIEGTYLYGNASFDTLDYLAPVFIGLFVFLFVFILTSVAFLRERSAGTLERLQATPIRRHEIILGYMIGFSAFALLQSLLILGFTILVLRVHYTGSLIVVFVVEILLAMMAVNMGIFFSTFARNEFQIVQFIPLVLVTQFAFSGMIWAIEDMPSWLQPIAWLMPLTPANRALRDVMIKGFDLVQIAPYLLALIAFATAFVVLAAQTVRRQVAR